jgi:hypothetical protein
MDHSALANAIYSGQYDQILPALTAMRQADTSVIRQVVGAAVQANYIKVGGDVIWKTPVDDADPTLGGNPKIMAWMIKTGWRTTASIALSDLKKLSDEKLDELAHLLTKDKGELTKIAFP